MSTETKPTESERIEELERRIDRLEGSDPRLPDPKTTRRGVLAGGAGLMALLFGTSTAAARSTKGYSCRWRGDVNADGYGLYGADVIELLSQTTPDTEGAQIAYDLDGNDCLYLLREEGV